MSALPPSRDEAPADRPEDSPRRDDAQPQAEQPQTEQPQTEEDSPGQMPRWLRTEAGELEGANLASLGLGFAGAVALLSFLGLWLDRRFGSSPWLLLSGLAIGLVGGTVSLVRRTARASRPGSAARRRG
jgi:F0F1-type ATP synthase assembly protein I